MTRRLARHPLGFSRGTEECPAKAGKTTAYPGPQRIRAPALARSRFSSLHLPGAKALIAWPARVWPRFCLFAAQEGDFRWQTRSTIISLAAAAALQLPLEPDWQAAVKANLAVTLQHANFVAGFALPDEAEPAPIYKA